MLEGSSTISKWAAALVAFCCLCGAASAQQAQSAPATAQNPAAQKIPPVSTTVVVHGQTDDTYLPDAVTVGTLDGASLKETPLSATVVTHEILLDQGARLLTDVVKNDASIGEDYAPVGYYGDYQIRGFPIDLATGLEINGLTIAGEQDVPLENKERVELLKGIAGLESGVASAGGLIDYVTKRPAMVKALDLATDQRGTAYGAADLGHLFGSRKQVGARVNLGGERIATYVNDANGWRAVGAGAADWQHDAEGDSERRLRISAQGGAERLRLSTAGRHDGSRSERDSSFDDAGRAIVGEAEYVRHVQHRARASTTICRMRWKAFAAASLSHSLIDDNVVYAYGCSYEALCQGNGGTAPDYFFAPDGGYDIYDYRDPGELRIDAQGGGAGHGPCPHRRNQPRSCRRIRVVSAQRATAGRAAGQLPTRPCRMARSTPTSARKTSISRLLPFPYEDPHQSAGPRTLWEDNHQSGLMVQDRIHLPGHMQLHGGRAIRLAPRS